jgi:hypothetical protein
MLTGVAGHKTKLRHSK